MTHAKGRPIRMHLCAGQTRDYTGASALVRSLPKAGVLLAERGYDANLFRNALTDMGILPSILSRRNRKVPIEHESDLFRKRQKIENTFERINDRRIGRHPLRPMRRFDPLSPRTCRNRHVPAMRSSPKRYSAHGKLLNFVVIERISCLWTPEQDRYKINQSYQMQGLKTLRPAKEIDAPTPFMAPLVAVPVQAIVPMTQR